jgi:hypothetical protein
MQGTFNTHKECSHPTTGVPLVHYAWPQGNWRGLHDLDLCISCKGTTQLLPACLCGRAWLYLVLDSLNQDRTPSPGSQPPTGRSSSHVCSCPCATCSSRLHAQHIHCLSACLALQPQLAPLPASCFSPPGSYAGPCPSPPPTPAFFFSADWSRTDSLASHTSKSKSV